MEDSKQVNGSVQNQNRGEDSDSLPARCEQLAADQIQCPPIHELIIVYLSCGSAFLAKHFG